MLRAHMQLHGGRAAARRGGGGAAAAARSAPAPGPIVPRLPALLAAPQHAWKLRPAAGLVPAPAALPCARFAASSHPAVAAPGTAHPGPPRRSGRTAARSVSPSHSGAPRHGGIDEALKRLAAEQLASTPSEFASGGRAAAGLRARAPGSGSAQSVLATVTAWQLRWTDGWHRPKRAQQPPTAAHLSPPPFPGEGVLDSIVKVYCVYSRSDWLLPWQAHPKREGTGEGGRGARFLGRVGRPAAARRQRASVGEPREQPPPPLHCPPSSRHWVCHPRPPHPDQRARGGGPDLHHGQAPRQRDQVPRRRWGEGEGAREARRARRLGRPFLGARAALAARARNGASRSLPLRAVRMRTPPLMVAWTLPQTGSPPPLPERAPPPQSWRWAMRLTWRC
jgi:hypothetical protein